ncbi:MAG: hypothetical protein PVG65_00865 [Candidatus Thorarchaeota archaeon]|jgi:predicted PurR-regulated permease PerM
MGDENLSREDLFLLLESYKNQIRLNTTLLEKQEQVIQSQNRVIEKLDSSRLDSAKEFSSVKNRIYIALGSTGTIIVSLIYLIYLLLDKFKLLGVIARKLGVGV